VDHTIGPSTFKGFVSVTKLGDMKQMSRKVRIEGYEYETAVLSERGLYGSSSGPAGAMVGKVGDV